MKKIICFLSVILSFTVICAQVKKEKKFVEIYNSAPESYSNPILDLQKKYYMEMKSSILQNEKELGESNVNAMLIYNQDEFYKAVRNSNSKFGMNSQQTKTADLVYSSNITSKLDLYKDMVLEKLHSLLAGK
ncbi:hypothetical protein EGY05_05040 [Chryseobacterium arthrosphaerae]|uniref:hypothetical protein n=1 Tax=Chryseobacterium arthrosphaerae TaxID=651561 RepID=UPI000F4D655E|nr:hypothetical protein [Chryseobacterium arthrosphaerae]AYZ11331.1 hypothetical protein EGY05_05040 [Chryseobacterium arthrosphaerae]